MGSRLVHLAFTKDVLSTGSPQLAPARARVSAKAKYEKHMGILSSLVPRSAVDVVPALAVLRPVSYRASGSRAMDRSGGRLLVGYFALTDRHL